MEGEYYKYSIAPTCYDDFNNPHHLVKVVDRPADPAVKKVNPWAKRMDQSGYPLEFPPHTSLPDIDRADFLSPDYSAGSAEDTSQ